MLVNTLTNVNKYYLIVKTLKIFAIVLILNKTWFLASYISGTNQMIHGLKKK